MKIAGTIFLFAGGIFFATTLIFFFKKDILHIQREYLILTNRLSKKNVKKEKEIEIKNETQRKSAQILRNLEEKQRNESSKPKVKSKIEILQERGILPKRMEKDSSALSGELNVKIKGTDNPTSILQQETREEVVDNMLRGNNCPTTLLNVDEEINSPLAKEKGSERETTLLKSNI